MCALAQQVDSSSKSWGIIAKGGAYLGGEYYVEPKMPYHWYETDLGLFSGLELEAILARSFSAGFFVHSVFTSSGRFDGDITIMTMGLTLKGRIDLGSVELRPGAALGYQISAIEDSNLDNVTGFSPGAMVQVAYPLQNGHAVVGEVGFITQPIGGNDQIDLTFGLHFYLALGYEFGG